MSESIVFPRRDFLKLVGLGVAAAASGCAEPPAEKLIPYLVPPTDILVGIPYWYASTCRECPVGCGILVKAREGRAIKVEGNPAHPMNRGGLCSRAHGALQGLYDPDRVRQPMVKKGGAWQPISWDDALKLAGDKLSAARVAHHGVALLTDHVTGTMAAFIDDWKKAVGASHLAYEAFAQESLREANRRTFGQATIPNFDFGAAKMIVSFGADFLETWLDVPGNARGFAAARAGTSPAHFVSVEPRLSLTGSNADEWIAVRPGGEMALALGMARVILSEGLGPTLAERGSLFDAVSPFTPEAVETQIDVPADRVQEMARHFAKAAPSLAVTGGIAAQNEQSVALAAAVNLLNYVAGNLGKTVRFDRTLNLDGLGSFADLQKLIGDMSEGRVEVLVVNRANPAYSAPGWAGLNAALDKVGFKISLSSVLDETAEACDLLLPTTHALETLDDAEPAKGVHSMVQPALKPLPMFDARPSGDVMIALGKAAGVGAAWPDAYGDTLKARWKSRLSGDFETAWTDLLAKGGQFEDAPPTSVRWAGAPAFAAPELKGSGSLSLVLFASPNLYDGRGANKAWLQELPDPTTKATWGTWVELHPDTAAKIGVKNGDAVKVQTEAGSVEVPAYVWAGVRPDVAAIPLGNGHTSYGRFAKGVGVNALALLSPAQDGASGALAYVSAKAQVSRGTHAPVLSVTQPHKGQEGRGIAQVIPVAALLGGAAAMAKEPGAERREENPMAELPGRDTEPRAGASTTFIPAHAITAFQSEEPARHPRAMPVDVGSYKNAKHHWAMSIDLNSCTGCSACMVSCSAENNVPTVGPELQRRGRDMFWIRIDRFEEKVGGSDAKVDVRHVPMMCQHCNDAPCEIVCPVYATYHTPEGLNGQVYNRCVGTRYCSNNCPYKVRAFNWFSYTTPDKPTFAFPEPLNWQLNPDVTVRSKGVMEKCTMCIQRILEGKGKAKDENRELHDGEFTTACAQSCPTQAIVFGDLMDPNSKVSKLSRGDPRRYWVLNELNTKPNVTYLKKVTWES
ncbi:MAG TPA: molybdopterin-dependent oxidoreductase [Candidatus Sulfotelmatobacter sp.]|nr:molybdopterin-dependent oxidoreductase [Candidatus Sulfotelmatobacter sp.]